MTKKNIRLKTHLGNGVYDTLHPETNSGIVRVGDKNLDETLGDVTAQLSRTDETLGEVTTQLAQNEGRLETVNTTVNGLKTGLGNTFNTLSELELAYPSPVGDTKDHVVAENGHRYYWDDGWKDGGLWNAVAIGNNSVTPETTTFLNYTKEPINYLDKSKIISGGYYNNIGVYVTSSQVSSSDFIEVNSGDILQIRVVIGGNYSITYWNTNNVFVSGVMTAFGENEKKEIVVPTNINRVKIAVRNLEIDSFFVGKNNNGEYDFIELNENVSIEKSLLKINTSPLVGFKWGIVGDSISSVGYKGDGKEYPKQISDRNNMTLNNLAVPGSMITKTNNSAHLTDHMCQRVLELDLDCDIVTVMGGVNDSRNNVPLGVFGDTDITTFYGAMEALCINMITRFPDTPKCIFTPIQHRGNNAKLIKIVDAIIEVASDKYGIPVFDNFRRSDLHPDIDFINNNYFYDTGNGTGDGLHPN